MTDKIKTKLKTVDGLVLRDSLELVTLVSIFCLAVGGVVPQLWKWQWYTQCFCLQYKQIILLEFYEDSEM